jgi:hypothetical protein
MTLATPAPVVLFAYNRPWHVSKCLESLAGCRDSSRTSVIAFVDGPKTSTDPAKIREVMTVISKFSGRFAELEIVPRQSNFGLAANVIDGVDRVISDFGRAIVLEDDMIVSSGFLHYMNHFLDLYAHTPRVGSIHGYSIPGIPLAKPYYFLRGGDCWGWATWNDRWKLFRSDGRELLAELLERNLLRTFTLGHTAPYCRLLCQQILRLNNSWAIRWHASLFLADRLTLYPTHSFVKNIGLDGSGENCGDIREYDTMIFEFDVNAPLPSVLEADPDAEMRYRNFYLPRTGLPSSLHKLASFLGDWIYVLRTRWPR